MAEAAKEPEKSTASVAVEHTAGDSSTSAALQAVLVKLEPAMKQAAQAVEKASPYVQKMSTEGKKLWAVAQPYQVETLFPAALGMALLLAGGLFPTVVLSFEAVRASGTWPQIKQNVTTLKSNYQAAVSAADKDAPPPPPGASRPLDVHTLLKSLNTEAVSGGSRDVATALFAILATLRIHLAYAMTVGSSVAQTAHQFCGAAATDAVARSLPEESRRLAPLVVNGALRTAGFLLALAMSRTAFALYAATAGARLVTEHSAEYLRLTGKAPKAEALLRQHAREAVLALGTLGFMWQMYAGGEYGFLLHLLLLPLLLVEWAASLTFSILA